MRAHSGAHSDERTSASFSMRDLHAVPEPLQVPLVTGAAATTQRVTGAAAPTQRDVLAFQLFRILCGGGVLGLTALLIIFGLAPLVLEPPDSELPPAPPAPPWKLWTEHDSEAGKTILLISAAQACLLLSCWLVYRWRKRRQGQRGADRTGKLRESKAALRPLARKKKPKRAQEALAASEPRAAVADRGGGSSKQQGQAPAAPPDAAARVELEVER